MIEEEIALIRRFEVGQAAGYAACAFSVLVRIDSVELGQPGDPGRIRGSFPSTYARPLDGEREENVGVAQDVVVEEILRAGAEVGYVEDPPGKRNGQAEFVLLVALTPQRQEAEALLRSLIE